MDTKLKTFIIIGHNPALDTQILSSQLQGWGGNLGKLAPGTPRTKQRWLWGQVQRWGQPSWNIFFKHKVNRSSLASTPLPRWGCFTFLRSCMLGRRGRGAVLPSRTQLQPHSLAGESPQSALRMICFEIQSPGTGQMALVCANALCSLSLKVPFFSIWKVSTSFGCLIS